MVHSGVQMYARTPGVALHRSQMHWREHWNSDTRSCGLESRKRARPLTSLKKKSKYSIFKEGGKESTLGERTSRFVPEGEKCTFGRWSNARDGGKTVQKAVQTTLRRARRRPRRWRCTGRRWCWLRRRARSTPRARSSVANDTYLEFRCGLLTALARRASDVHRERERERERESSNVRVACPVPLWPEHVATTSRGDSLYKKKRDRETCSEEKKMQIS